LIKKVLIVGTGALATFYSIKLSKKFDVTLLGTWDEGIVAINKGAVLEDQGVLVSGSVKALKDWSNAKEADLTIWLTKSYKNLDLLSRYKKIGLSHPILILQNGIGQVKTFKEILGNDILIYEGVTAQAARLKQPGYVVNAGNGNLSISANPLIETILLESEIQYLVVDDIQKEKLNKLAINCVLNPITALFRVNNGDAVKGVAGEKLLELIKAVFPFFDKRGVFKSEEKFFEVVKNIAEKTSGNKNSMLMDVLSNRQTEIKQILFPIQLEVKSDLLEEIINKLK
jgi:2-dehydropantoate 2-reductase